MKSLVTILSGGPQSVDVLKSVVILQKELEAQLIVAHPKAPLPTAAAMVGDAGMAMPIIELAESEYSTEGAKQAFEAVCGRNPLCRFRDTQMTPHDTLRKYSLFADLVVLARDTGLADTSLD